MLWASPRRRLPLTLALLAGLAVIAVVLSRGTGSRPEAGATYTGTVYVETPAGRITQKLPISFGIDRAGNRVGAFRISGRLPAACPESKLGPLVVLPASGPIRGASRFEVNLAVRSGTPGSTGRIGTLEISGIFHSLHREGGAVATRYSTPRLRGCDADGGYTTKADA